MTPSTMTPNRHPSVYEVPVTSLAGEPLDPRTLRGRATLIVNVASRCGLTPQYEGLQELYETYRGRGLVVIGAPCDQFAGQEPGDADEIAEFCAQSYSVTFPLTEKLDVNGRRRHPIYEILASHPDQFGTAGDVQWNFEKFLVSPRGEVVGRFRPLIQPDDEQLVAAIEAALPEHPTPILLATSADQIEPGDHVVVDGGGELTVSRIERQFLGNDDLVCLIEDTPRRWLAQPMQARAEVRVLSTTIVSTASSDSLAGAGSVAAGRAESGQRR